MEKRYYWLKFKEDFFGSKRIKKLRKMAGGDTYVIIYLKMQLKALRTNGVLEFTGLEDNFADELALDIEENPEDVRIVVTYLLTYGLCECSDNVHYFLPWVKENTGSETASTQRSRDSRKRKKLQCNTTATQLQQICNATETQLQQPCNVEKEIEKEIDIESETEKNSKTISKEMVSCTDVQRVIEAWNGLGLGQVRKVVHGTQREQLLKKRIKDYGADEVLRAVGNVKESTFLNGNNSKGWIITFDWFIKPNNFQKVLEGNYAERIGKSKLDDTYAMLERWANSDES